MAKKPYPPTQLRELYDAFGHLKEDEQIALAELHVAKPIRLANRLAHSLKTVSSELYPPLEEEEFTGKDRTDLPKPGLSNITDTEGFVSNLADGRRHTVNEADELGFRYVAREISPLRVTEEGGPRPGRRSLDLLLMNDQGGPIAAELKVAKDSPSYYALIQALMYASELQSPSQRARLLKHYGGSGIRTSAEAPLIDVYLVSFEPPESGKYRERFERRHGDDGQAPDRGRSLPWGHRLDRLNRGPYRGG